MRRFAWVFVVAAVFGTQAVDAAVITYGDKDVLNGTGIYPMDPVTGATLQGLAPGASTFGQPELNHGFPFAPSGGEFAGTDQIYVGSVQTGFMDGYSGSIQRINGPQVIAMNYASLIPAGQTVETLTLGIAADDFQNVPFGQPFSAYINGILDPNLTALLNSLDQSGPQVQFFTIGIDPAWLLPSHILTLTIDQGGNGGDGWAIDFLTIGVTTVPEPGTLTVFGLLAAGGLVVARRRRKRTA